jgi:glycosyltransferase involved in cell wall biosynthesis
MSNTWSQEIWESGKLISSSVPKPTRVTWYNFPFLYAYTWGRLMRIGRCYGKVDLTVGASMPFGNIALRLRDVGRSRRAVLLLQDHFPVKGSVLQRLWRQYHAAFSRITARRANEVWMVSSRIPTAGVPADRRHVIPLYVDDNGTTPEGRTDIAYVGHPIEDHCLPLLFDVCRKHGIRLHFVGQGPYLSSIKHLAPSDTIFYGFVGDPEKLQSILSHCFCGYAMFRSGGPENYIWYGVPSKIFLYLANNVPTVSTDITEFSGNITTHSLGKLVEPTADQVESAILHIRDHYRDHYDSISNVRAQWNRQVEAFLNERLDSLIGAGESPKKSVS